MTTLFVPFSDLVVHLISLSFPEYPPNILVISSWSIPHLHLISSSSHPHIIIISSFSDHYLFFISSLYPPQLCLIASWFPCLIFSCQYKSPSYPPNCLPLSSSLLPHLPLISFSYPSYMFLLPSLSHLHLLINLIWYRQTNISKPFIVTIVAPMAPMAFIFMLFGTSKPQIAHIMENRKIVLTKPNQTNKYIL